MSSSLFRMWTFSIIFLGICDKAYGHTPEAGSFFLGPLVGPSLKLNSLVGGTPAYFVLGGLGEYVVDRNLSVLGDIKAGLGTSQALHGHLGGRLRVIDLEGPLSFYIQGQLGLGGLFGVIGANLLWAGVRAGVGADYFLVADIALGTLLAFDLGATTGTRPALYTTLELLFLAKFRI